MSKILVRRMLVAHCLVLAVASSFPATAQPLASASPAPAPDSGLFTSYSMGPGYTSVNWLVCGSTQQNKGCYDLGTMGKFGRAAALMEGNPMVDASTGTVTREIYVCDVAAGTTGAQVALVDYRRTDVVSSSDDATNVTLVKSVPLSLKGGAGATCFMAANNGHLFIGTDKGKVYAEVTKSTLHAQSLTGSGNAVSSITADKYGFVEVTFDNSAHVGYGPNGTLVENQVAVDYKVGTTVGLSTNSLPTSSAALAERGTRIGAGENARQRTGGSMADAIDSDVYTDYYTNSNFQDVGYEFCRVTSNPNSCYGAASLGTFGHAGAIIEGNKQTNVASSTVTRDIYVCDDAAGSGAGVKLYAYRRIDTIFTSVSSAVSLIKTLTLPLVGGPGANCQMAANNHDLFVGTRKGTTAVKVAKAGYAITPISANDATLPLATITADKYGFAAMTFGAGGGSPSGVDDFDPAGNIVQATSGAYFMLDTTASVQAGQLPVTSAAMSDAMLGVRARKLSR